MAAEGKLSLLEWTRKYRSNLAPERAFDLNGHAYLKAIYEETAQEVVLRKAAQLGASEYLVSYILQAADVRGATGLYVLPTDSHVSDFSAARVGAAMDERASPYLASIVVAGDKHGADRVGLKRMRDRFIYFRGAKVKPDGSAPQLRSIDADVLVLDEFDEMDRRAEALARKRLGHSTLAEVRIVSTPTFANVGIDAEYQASDRREWHFKCPSCGEWTAPTLDDLVLEWDSLERPVRWNGQVEGGPSTSSGQKAGGEPYLACRKCKGALDRSGAGEWVAAYPDREVHGYHLTRLFVPQTPLAGIITGLEEVDENKRQQVFNQDLGLPYRSTQATALTDVLLDGCRREYGHGVVALRQAQGAQGAQGSAFMGVDVGRVLHTVIRQRQEDGGWRQVWAGEVTAFEDLSGLMERYGVKTCVVDALPETRKAREFQETQKRGRVWLAYYTGQGQKGGTKKESPIHWDEKERVVNLDRTRTLDATLGLFALAARGEPGNTLPANARDIRDYYAHLRAPERRLEDGPDGNQVAVYVESGPDHYAHAENYCYVASEARVVNAGVSWL